MNTDIPLKYIEEDELGRAIFATEIASGLVGSFKNSSESIVIGINGSWGSGKSTLINFIIQEVERLSNIKDEEIIVLKFNPWMFSGQRELQNIFLKELLFKIGSKKTKLKNASKKIAEFLGHINWLKYVNSGAGEVIKDAQSFLEGINQEKDLNLLKEDIDNLLIESDVKIYITIDDIDRLIPSEITDIFQLVKLNGNFANTIFILAYDQEVVINALKRQFGENGKKYIEKIVQIDYTIPNIPKEDLNGLFVKSLNNLFEGHEISTILHDLSNEIRDEQFVKYFKSVRDVYRFNNSLKLRLPSLYKDVNILDFFHIESLRIFDTEVYEFILENKEVLVYNKENKPIPIIENTDFSSLAKQILMTLFTGNFQFALISRNADDLIREKRIANKDYFDRYFNLRLGKMDFKEEFLQEFINGQDIQKKIEILETIQKKNLIFEFLRVIEIKSFYEDATKIRNLILASLKYTDKLHFYRSGMWSSGGDFMTIQRFCSKYLERLKDLEVRRKVILEHISKPKMQMTVSSYFNLETILFAKKKLKEGQYSYNDMWYHLFSKEEDDQDFLTQISKLIRRATKEIFQNEIGNRYLNDDELLYVLPATYNYHPKYYIKNFSILIESDKDLIRYVSICISRNYLKSTAGTGYKVEKWQFIPGLNIEEIYKRFIGLKRKELETEEKRFLDLFLKAHEDGFSKDIYYNITTLEKMEGL